MENNISTTQSLLIAGGVLVALYFFGVVGLFIVFIVCILIACMR